MAMRVIYGHFQIIEHWRNDCTLFFVFKVVFCLQRPLVKAQGIVTVPAEAGSWVTYDQRLPSDLSERPRSQVTLQARADDMH